MFNIYGDNGVTIPRVRIKKFKILVREFTDAHCAATFCKLDTPAGSHYVRLSDSGTKVLRLSGNTRVQPYYCYRGKHSDMVCVIYRRHVITRQRLVANRYQL
uniref:Uncharacterized protein n=1 Tax=Schizaphis graminum TaxID=13262 RepID=A0A2S2PCM7_SCHGA